MAQLSTNGLYVMKQIQAVICLIVICCTVATYADPDTIAQTINRHATTDAPQAATAPNTDPQVRIQQFIDKMVTQYHFDRATLSALLLKSRHNPQVIHRVTHPAEAWPWDIYQRVFIQSSRVERAVQYWKKYATVLQAVQTRYGVEPSIVIAIIAVESNFGNHLGSFNTLDALTTLSFYHPGRQAFFTRELEHFFLLAREIGRAADQITGSYAGALGIPQFMPRIYRLVGVAYTQGQPIDLFTNHADAIASVAHYLKREGWIANQPVALPAVASKAQVAACCLYRPPVPHTLAYFQEHDIKPIEKIEHSKLSPATRATLIAMHSTQTTEYWLVFQNFNAIMQYNPKQAYALAVFQLSQAIKKAYARQHTLPKSTTAPSTRPIQSR